MSHKGFIFVLLMFKPIIVYPNMYYNNSYVLNGEHEIVALVVSHARTLEREHTNRATKWQFDLYSLVSCDTQLLCVTSIPTRRGRTICWHSCCSQSPQYELSSMNNARGKI